MEIVIERTYDASPQKVWRALTEVDILRNWYFNIPEFKTEIGFVFQFKYEGSCDWPTIHQCVVTEVIPFQKISYSWGYEGLPGRSQVTFEIFEASGGTLLRLTHEDLANFPPAVVEKKNFQAGWDHFINTALPNFLNTYER